MMMPSQDVWEKNVKDWMTNCGWICDRDDEENLGFSKHEDEYHWIRDYNKKTRAFIQYNGNQKINLVSTKEKIHE